MGMTCAKCGSTEILPDIPVVSGVDRLAEYPISALAYLKPEARWSKGAALHPLLARVCGTCGFAELYVKAPQGLAAIVKRGVDDA
jgi:predicted nucleic-acid-binding Zn-ribbon protein